MDVPRDMDRSSWRTLPAGMVISTAHMADGWALRRYDWAPPAGVKPRGSLFFQGGRGDFIEKYIEALTHWHGRGWRLTGFDWRGQGGSGRLLADPAIGHADSFDVWVDDLDAMVGQWLAESPGPHVLAGHSMGGHLVLRLLAERRPAVDAAILVSPMLGFSAGPLPLWAVRLVTTAACRIGLGERAAWGGGRGPEAMPAHRERNLTHSPERYSDEIWWRAHHPELAIGAPSWGWLRAGAESMARLAAPGVLEAVGMPLLILGTPHDGLVDSAAIRRAAARLPTERLCMYDEGAHELLRETDAVRLPALAAIDAYLEETVG